MAKRPTDSLLGLPQHTSHVILTISGEDSYVAVVVHRYKSLQALKEAIREAVEEFVATPAGKAYLESTGDINWGDVASEVPESILEAHGVYELGIHPTWEDMHDRNFASDVPELPD